MVNPLKTIDSLLSLLAQYAIWTYQHLIGPLMRFFAIAPSPCCYQPTCSNYAREAFQTHPFVFALALSLRRIMRCHPLAKGGYDPVPPPKTSPGTKQ